MRIGPAQLADSPAVLPAQQSILLRRPLSTSPAATASSPVLVDILRRRKK